MLTLKEYLDKNKMSQAAFSRRSQLDQAQVSRFLSGSSLPTLETAYKIFRASKKAVRMEVWLDDKVKSHRYR